MAVYDEWMIKRGDREIKVSSVMVASSLDKAIAVMNKAIYDNRELRHNEIRRDEWETAIQILDLVRSKFEGLSQVQ